MDALQWTLTSPRPTHLSVYDSVSTHQHIFNGPNAINVITSSPQPATHRIQERKKYEPEAEGSYVFHGTPASSLYMYLCVYIFIYVYTHMVENAYINLGKL